MPQTGHTLGAPFLPFWQSNGGVRIFGYPISEVVVENGLKVPVLERGAHGVPPEKLASGFGVELGLLGRRLLDVRSGQTNSRAVSPSPEVDKARSPQPEQRLPPRKGKPPLCVDQRCQAAAAGAGPVSLDPQLRGIALSRSRDMVARHYFSHTTPDGVDFITMLKHAQVPFKFAGEIITEQQQR